MAYRLYTFVNHLYMSPIQWGIQTAHVVCTLSVKYKHNTKQHKAYVDWAANEPTIIVCQGGNVAMLTDTAIRLTALANQLDLARAEFYEDEQSLGGIITAVGVLVPDTLFDVSIVNETDESGQRVQHFVSKDDYFTYKPGHIQHDFMSIIKNARLA